MVSNRGNIKLFPVCHVCHVCYNLSLFHPTHSNYIEEVMGGKYTEGRAVEFAKSFEESGPATPIFFILSPGVDPLKDVEKLGKVLGYTGDNNNFHNISLGQGQEVVAEQAMELAAKEGHWVVLQVIRRIYIQSSWT